MISRANRKYLLCTRHCCEHLMCTISGDPHSYSPREVSLRVPIMTDDSTKVQRSHMSFSRSQYIAELRLKPE